MDNIKQFYDETNIEYIKRIYDNIIKKSVTSAVVSMSDNIHKIKLNDELLLKIKKAVFISGMVTIGVSTVNAGYYLHNSQVGTSIEKNIDDFKEEFTEKAKNVTDSLKKEFGTQPEVIENEDIYQKTQDRLSGKVVEYPTSPNTDIIGFAKLIVSSGEAMNKDLYEFYINHSQDTFDKLIESIIFIDPSIDDSVVKNFDDYVKMKGFNSVQEWIEFSKSEADNKNSEVSFSK